MSKDGAGSDHEKDKENKEDKEEKHLKAQVYTTSGSYPQDGYASVKATDPVSELLKKAKEKLRLTDTEGWDASVGGNLIDPNKTYQQNGLTGTVTIQWGPHEGGGG